MRVEPGGLSNINEVKILICRVLNELDNPIAMSDLTDGMLADGYVNYFDYAIAINDLCENGHVRKETEDGRIVFYLTEDGKNADRLLGANLPLAVCEKVYAAVLAARSGGRAICTIEPHELGCFVRMRFILGGRELFNVKLEAGDEMTAEDMKRNFLKNPHDVYISLVKLIK
ncbi:MAG: DUF4364 family protein [Clostridia bacterium]|nr:DUF4364 family protein [Clostridia bacterium]